MRFAAAGRRSRAALLWCGFGVLLWAALSVFLNASTAHAGEGRDHSDSRTAIASASARPAQSDPEPIAARAQQPAAAVAATREAPPAPVHAPTAAKESHDGNASPGANQRRDDQTERPANAAAVVARGETGNARTPVVQKAAPSPPVEAEAARADIADAPVAPSITDARVPASRPEARAASHPTHAFAAITQIAAAPAPSAVANHVEIVTSKGRDSRASADRSHARDAVGHAANRITESRGRSEHPRFDAARTGLGAEMATSSEVRVASPIPAPGLTVAATVRPQAAAAATPTAEEAERDVPAERKPHGDITPPAAPASASASAPTMPGAAHLPNDESQDAHRVVVVVPRAGDDALPAAPSHSTDVSPD